jgi:hypothetical protein
MNPADPVLHRQLPVIRKIIEDETWLEGERRGCHVSPYDRVVRENVCRVILQVGGQIRESVTRDLPTGTVTNSVTITSWVPEGVDWEI